MGDLALVCDSCTARAVVAFFIASLHAVTMMSDPTHEEINEDDDQPATRGYVRQQIAELKKFIAQENEETRRHFDVVAENIHVDVAGANADEISLIKNKQDDHEDRIVDLERTAGVPDGPRFGRFK
jgi:hypothetical protein